MVDQIMAPFDFEMASMLHRHVKDMGVELILSDGVAYFDEKGRKIGLTSGKIINTDLTIMSIGVRPENELAKSSGLKLGDRGHIKVDQNMMTSDPNIYAIGDAVETIDYIYKEPAMVPLAWPANKQGRIVADRINGIDSSYPGTLGTSIAKVFDLTASSTGHNEKALARMGKTNYKAIHIHPGSHAGYYPGAFPISLKLIFEVPSGRILGAQAIGYDGVDKRIDVIATAIKGNLTVRDITDLELAYAPPYSSAKDPVNMAGYVATNILDGLVDIVYYHEIDKLVADGGILLDIRDAMETDMSEIEGSINIPLNELRDRLGELPKDKEIYVTCQVGLRGYIATRILTQNGYKAKNLDGGTKTYTDVYGSTDDNTCGYVDDSGEMHTFDKNIDTFIGSTTPDVTVDAKGLQCPGPIAQVYNAISTMEKGQMLEVLATDPGFSKDISAWCRKTGNTLLSSDFEKTHFRTLIRKGTEKLEVLQSKNDSNSPLAQENKSEKNGATMVVFSGDLDKAMASFIIATGAASMGKEVTMFFTFWGLNVLRKPGVKVKKDALENMFSKMMPEGSKKLKLSKMNMGGMGSKMINYIMKKKNVDDVETLIANAQKMGIKLVACAMSMDLMGIKEEELLDGVEIAGVASYLAETDDSNLNLFI